MTTAVVAALLALPAAEAAASRVAAGWDEAAGPATEATSAAGAAAMVALAAFGEAVELPLCAFLVAGVGR